MRDEFLHNGEVRPEAGKPCFFTWCYSRMEEDCLDRKLLALGKWALEDLKSVRKGDIGFLVNVERDQLVGVFEAEGPGILNADSGLWGGKYPAQVKVRLIGELHRINGAAEKLNKVVQLWEPRKGWKVPNKIRYGPEITAKLLKLFESGASAEANSMTAIRSETILNPSSKTEYVEMTPLITELVDYVSETDESYIENFEPDLVTYPIPFFGDPYNAEVITVGVNPSATEFRDREWPSSLSPDNLLNRLKNYFKLPTVPPHRWFETWEEGLQLLGCSYYANAAHMDLSPRATVAMSRVPNKSLFEEMIREDTYWFFKFLQVFTNPRLMLIAGSVTNELYMNEFLAMHAPFDFKLEGSLERLSGPAKIAHHALSGPDMHLPVFFCSVSPSWGESYRLVERIKENRTFLKKQLM